MSQPEKRSAISTAHAVSEKRAADYCGWSYATIRRHRDRQSGPPYFQAGGKGKRVVYPLDALKAWIVANLCSGNPPSIGGN